MNKKIITLQKNQKRDKTVFPIIIFLFLIIAPTIMWGIFSIMSMQGSDIMTVVDYDLGEKRNKATFSEIIDINNATAELEKVYNDRIPFRSFIIDKKRLIDATIEKNYGEVEKVLMNILSGGKARQGVIQATTVDGKINLYMDDAVDIFLGHGLKKDEVDTYFEGVEIPIKFSDNKKIIVGQSNWLFLNGENIAYYQGKKELEDNAYATYTAPYSAIKNLLKNYDKEFAILVCPEKEEIYSEYMPTMEILDEKERPYRISDYIATNSDVIYVYPKKEILDLKSKYRLYHKYDSHWNGIGSYIAYETLMKKLGIEVPVLRDINVKKIPDTWTDLVYLSNMSFDTKDTFDYEIDYKNYINTEVIYEDPITKNLSKVKSTAENDRKIVLIGDSYRLYIETFLSKDFSSVTSFSYLQLGDTRLTEALKEADIIIFESVERNESYILPEMCQRVYQLFTNGI